MRLVQLSRESLQFPPPEMALREPNGLLAMGVISPLPGYLTLISAASFRGFLLATRFSGGRPIPVQCYCLSSFISAGA